MCTALGILWLLWHGLRTVFGTFGGGFMGIASLAGCLSVRCPRIWTFGPMLPTSAGGLTWATRLFQARPPLPATVSSALPGSPQAGPSCLETIQRFTRAAGFSLEVAAQASLARRPSSRSNYQLKWSVYWPWCRSQGCSISRPSLSKVADFLWWLLCSRS